MNDINVRVFCILTGLFFLIADTVYFHTSYNVAQWVGLLFLGVGIWIKPPSGDSWHDFWNGKQ